MKKIKRLGRRGLSLLMAAVFCVALLPTVTPAEAATSPSDAQAYLDILNSADVTDSYLIDFDGDGRDELVTTNNTSGQYVRVYQGEKNLAIEGGSDITDPVALGIYTKNEKCFLCVDKDPVMWEDHVFYTIQNGQWVQAAEFQAAADYSEGADGSSASCLIDGQKVTEEKYLAEKNSYQKKFHFDSTDGDVRPQLEAILQAEALKNATPIELLAQIPYYGDVSKCRLTAAQAAEIAQFLDNYQPEIGYSGIAVSPQDCRSILVDADSSGIPILMIHYNDKYDDMGKIDLCTWENGVLKVSQHLVSSGNSQGINFGKNRFGGYSWVDVWGNPGQFSEQIYTVKNGVLSSVSYQGEWDSLDVGGDWNLEKNGQPLSGLYTDEQLQEMEEQDGMVVDYIGFYDLKGTSLSELASVLRAYAFALKLQNATPEEILAEMAYAGDRSKCKMTAAQATAFADALEETLQSEQQREMGYGILAEAVLFDTSAGIPALLLTTLPSHSASSSDTHTYGWEYIEEQVAPFSGLKWFYIYPNYILWASSMGFANVCEFQNGHINHTATTLTEFGQIIDGKDVSEAEVSAWWDKWCTDDYLCRGSIHSGDSVGMQDAQTMLALLRAYADAKKYPTYAYTEADSSDAHYADIAAAVVGQGTIQAIYRLLDDLYYVLLENNGAYIGAVVRGVTKNGQPAWEISQVDQEPAEGAVLEEMISRLLSTANLMPDYGKLRGTPVVEDLAAYLRELLANYDGLSPNDAAKAELAAFVDSAVTAVASGSVSGKNNRLTLDSALVSGLAATAKSVWADLLSILNGEGVTLNKTVTPRVRLLWQELAPDQAFQITVDSSLVSGLNSANLQLLLGSGERYIQFSYDSLRQLTDELGTFSIQISQTGDNTYTINILDKDGQILDSLSSPITLGLPASSMTSTVMVSYIGGSDNWGGQYDEASGILAFEIRYSGQYEVLDNDLQIGDITELSEESQAAIRFMVSKGYFSLDENGLFHPGLPLTRYDFARTLVSMFFALDRSLTVSFTDVPLDSGYYAYVASAEANGLMFGTEDNLFAGEANMSVEQMLTVTGRTLAERKGYTVPEDAGQYLSGFEDGGSVSDWARLNVALSIREGLQDRGGMLNPQAAITREQAAVALYRLFLRLYEVPPVALDLPPESETAKTGSGNGAIIAVVAVVAIAGAGAAFVIGKKKKVAVDK